MRARLKAAVVYAVATLSLVVVPLARSRAQSGPTAWPQRTVRLILPFGAGSSTDIVARLLGERLQAKWGTPVVVENRPGGDGLLSIGSFVAANDDHTFFFGSTSAFMVHPYQHANLPYEAERDLVPIVQISKTLIVIAAPAALSASNLKEFVALVRANPGKLNYAMTPGLTEFVYDGFMREQGLVMSKVPYRDIVQAPTDLGEGRIHILMVSQAVAIPQRQAGRIKLLAVADTQRSELEPGVDSLDDAGFPSLASVSLLGAFGPRGMPIELRKRIAADVMALLQDPGIVERLRGAGQSPIPGGPEEFAAGIARQNAQVAGIAKLLGVSRQK